MKKTWATIIMIMVFSFGLVHIADALTPRQQLDIDVAAAPYYQSEYVTDQFDCSNMAGVMVDHLDKLGYNAEICVVKTRQSYLNKFNIDGQGSYHAFVIVDRQAIVEPTFKAVTFSEGKYDDYGTLDWYIEAWEIIGVYDDSKDAERNSKWSATEWRDWR